MKKFKIIVVIALVALLILGGFIFATNHACLNAAQGRIFRSTGTIPKMDVGLLLGCTKYNRSGSPNLHFNQRIDAAVALFRAGKIRHLLVSGDNHHWSYNEPADMRDALVAADVPTNAITCDYAGFRTLDSVVRAKEVFGLTRFTIISEAYHCPRALWIARRHGLDAVAFAAPNVSRVVWSLRASARETIARTWCALDLFVFNRAPKFLGPRQTLALSTNQP